ncbi:sensor histidine kinase [Acidocella aromatica]|uniref:histidine kinase n=1 Tax=Acidocella aromatica TaxID=1303579 RepID=A0A840VAI2_9PROT|nr:sensor histidine kinase KdpD [Acidocella aromatica]MBB5371837.1 two-component system sensor histidine kinase KdpD [Acidocella aromatica]
MEKPRPGDARPDPDALLASLRQTGRGHLKIFLGAAPGVGKTWEMLAAAHDQHRKGLDVVAGLIETHGRSGTAEKLGELELLPRLAMPYRGQVLEEFDLDAALARHPQLLLVDELAHTNAPGLRHAKRWQDVQELLEAGINVWTTVNVQHLESLNDQVARITGVRVAETIPDTVLDLADEIELIDLPPGELRTRLQEGHIYRPDVARRALEGFFREGNLGALREIALRRAAQRIDKDVANYMRLTAIPGPWPVAERVLALVGPDDTAQNVVRHATRLADALRAPLVAFHVERGDSTQVQTALDLAVQLGGTVVTVTARDLAQAVLDYAANNNVTHIVMGRTTARWRPRRRITEALTRQATAFTLHLVPLPAAPPPHPSAPARKGTWEPYLLASVLLGVVTLIGYIAKDYIPQEAMGLVFTGLIAAMASRSGRNAGLFTAAFGFLLWNFFFLPPLYTFSVSDPQDVVALLVFLLIGLLTGQLAGRVHLEASAAAARVEALRRISAFSQRFSRAATLSDVLRGAAEEAAAITGAGIVLMLGANGLEPEARIPAETALDEAASAAAEWCANHDVETGIGTSTLPSVAWRFVPLHANGKVSGVLGARPPAVPPPLAQTLSTLAGQASMAIERARMAMQTARAQAHEDSQKLRTALLSSLSHDLRTPLTAIRGAAETLEQAGAALDPATRADLLASISQNTALMTKFLANIMDMARVEAGNVTVKRERLRLSELIEAAISRVQGAEYTGVNIAPDASHALADPMLLEQVLVNILENAVKYAPPGSRIAVTVTRQTDKVRIAVADEGVGIPPAELDAVFDSFFRATRGDRVAPGTGLGLSIAKAFTEAMDGRISAQSPRLDLPADGLPGTIITLELPAA